jgi:hypothetical protein
MKKSDEDVQEQRPAVVIRSVWKRERKRILNHGCGKEASPLEPTCEHALWFGAGKKQIGRSTCDWASLQTRATKAEWCEFASKLASRGTRRDEISS